MPLSTHAVLAGSPAIDQGLNALGLSFDQRAFDEDEPGGYVREIGQGTAFAQRGSYLAAELFLKRAIAVDGKVRGPDHPGLAATLDKLATLYQAIGRYGAAEPLLKRAIAIDEKALGPEHPDLAGRLNNLAVLYWATGRPAAAEPLFVRALAILEKRLPPGHPVLAAIRENYVGCLGALGREKAAAARGQRPPVEDHGPWPEAAERERHGGPSTAAPPGPGPRGAGPVVLAAPDGGRQARVRAGR